jgi:hypothetical protein
MKRARMILAGAVATAAGLLLATVPSAQSATNDYSDPDYLAHDLDNVARSTVEGTQLEQLLDPAYHQALLPTSAESWLENLGEQLAALPQGRLYTGLAQLIPGGAVGDPRAYHDLDPIEVSFVSRTGAELQGRLFWDGLPGAHPGAVITTGSVQANQQGYWWAARTLARHGYLVLIWDVQGQGESEGFGHTPGDIVPTDDGFPFQQASNFVDGTVDALRFFLSSDAAPYRPVGWTDGDAAAVEAQGQDTIVWANPLAAFLDPTRLGLAGHSLGARAISVVQQCSDASELWRDDPVCGGRSFPIRAIVAWDSLSSAVAPTVPAMDQEADGYFLFPQPSFEAPDPSESLHAFEAWRAAGVDTYSFTVRAGTHLEWWQVPYILPSTTYGIRQVDHYTLAWFERYVQGDPARATVATAALLDGPRPDGATGGADELAWRANFFSARRLSAFSFTGADGTHHEARDLRAYAGLSPVGDWAGANADQPAERRAP